MGTRLSGAAGHTGHAIEQNAEINVTPFVDIMLVLLIIFMVAAPMATVSMKLDLPPPMEPDGPQKDPVYITVQESGAVFIGERRTSLASLPADVCAALGGGACRERRIFVRAEPEVSYEGFMAVMNGLYGAGFTQVGLLNEDIE
ncbi:biopolymer transporter ExbD [Roseibacterium beibuensis]|uniref:biopolymer transporter ExbD n=1 Tax=[Roseibacterium] beibuensis TaxID=1193142 RepID=UPI00217D20A9|nr:biopolymer transporter ExbD [Roseibacterium beibuensis]MCS6627605.1 biopolymer transporter ExbD [Roseibacterium beibuensis]